MKVDARAEKEWRAEYRCDDTTEVEEVRAARDAIVLGWFGDENGLLKMLEEKGREMGEENRGNHKILVTRCRII